MKRESGWRRWGDRRESAPSRGREEKKKSANESSRSFFLFFTFFCRYFWSARAEFRLPLSFDFRVSFCDLTELRRLKLVGICSMKAIPAKLSSLKKLNDITLVCCRLSSLPKELGELSGLTKLDLRYNSDLGNTPEDEAFPAELGNMKMLTENPNAKVLY